MVYNNGVPNYLEYFFVLFIEFSLVIIGSVVIAA